MDKNHLDMMTADILKKRFDKCAILDLCRVSISYSCIDNFLQGGGRKPNTTVILVPWY